MDSRSKDEMKKEAFVMKELSHPCIVRLYGVSQSRKMNSTLMVLINCSKNTLSFLLNGSIKCFIYFLFRIILKFTMNAKKLPVALVISSSKLTFYALTI
jgi:serine/threonine protein kinase